MLVIIMLSGLAYLGQAVYNFNVAYPCGNNEPIICKRSARRFIFLVR